MKKGEISIETIIVIVLALLVLIILAVAFSEGVRTTLGNLTGMWKSTSVSTMDEATKRCTDLCSKPNQFASQSYQVDNYGPVKCSELVTCG